MATRIHSRRLTCQASLARQLHNAVPDFEKWTQPAFASLRDRCNACVTGHRRRSQRAGRRPPRARRPNALSSRAYRRVRPRQPNAHSRRNSGECCTWGAAREPAAHQNFRWRTPKIRRAARRPSRAMSPRRQAPVVAACLFERPVARNNALFFPPRAGETPPLILASVMTAQPRCETRAHSTRFGREAVRAKRRHTVLQCFRLDTANLHLVHKR